MILKVKGTDKCFINKCRSDNQPCSCCGKKIGKGNYAYSVRKKCDLSSYNIWLHIRCLDNFYALLKESFEKNKEEIVLESI